MSTDYLLLELHDDSELRHGDVCNGRPPIVVRGGCCGHAAHRKWRDQLLNDSCYMCGNPDEALVLVWDGEELPLGVAWVQHVLGVEEVRVEFLAARAVERGLAKRIWRSPEE